MGGDGDWTRFLRTLASHKLYMNLSVDLEVALLGYFVCEFPFVLSVTLFCFHMPGLHVHFKSRINAGPKRGSRAGEVARPLRAQLFFQRTLVLFPAPHDSSQQSITPGPGSLMPSSGFYGYQA